MGRLKGFTLIELVVVIGLFAIVSSVIIGVYFQLIQAANRSAITTEVEQNVSYAMEIMVRDVREAGCAELDGGDLNLKDPECTEVVITFGTVEVEVDGHDVINLVKTEGLAESVLNNPDKTTVKSLTFSVGASGQSVTIDLMMESVRPAAHSEFKGEISLHETVSLRNY